MIENKENASRPPTIMQRIAAGDKTAIVDCLDVYGKLIWNLAGKHIRNAHDREDAVQEIFISIWQSAAVFDPLKSPEYAFVTLIARRRIITRIRRFYLSRKIFSASGNIPKTYVNNSHIDLQHKVEANFIVEILNNLEPLEKRILQLFIYDGLSHSEVAKALNIPLGTVKTKIRRRMEKIRNSIDKPAGNGQVIFAFEDNP